MHNPNPFPSGLLPLTGRKTQPPQSKRRLVATATLTFMALLICKTILTLIALAIFFLILGPYDSGHLDPTP